MRFFLVLGLAATLAAQTVAGLHWKAPAGWKTGPEKQMRAATYVIADGVECVVYFFGQGQGGSVQANLDRWKGQVTQPNGQPAVAKTAKRTVHGLAVTTIDTSGEYGGMGGAKTGGQRLLGAVIEGPAGNVFVKFSGPANVIAANNAKYDELINSFEKAH